MGPLNEIEKVKQDKNKISSYSLVIFKHWLSMKELQTILGGVVKQSDVVSQSGYMSMFSSTQAVYVFWSVHLIFIFKVMIDMYDAYYHFLN